MYLCTIYLCLYALGTNINPFYLASYISIFLFTKTPFATPQHVSNSLAITFLLNVSACNCMNYLLTVIPPSTKIYFTDSNYCIRMLSYNLNVIDSKIENKIFCFDTLKFKPEKVPRTADFQ